MHARARQHAAAGRAGRRPDVALMGYNIDGCMVLSTTVLEHLTITEDLRADEHVVDTPPFLDSRRIVVPDALDRLLVSKIGIYTDE